MMKKSAIGFLLLVVALTIAVLGSCAPSGNPIGEIGDYDSETRFSISQTNGVVQLAASGSIVGEDSAEQVGEFLVRERQYAYKDSDNKLVVLYVENQSQQNYTLTIVGQYLDGNGTVLKEETQQFVGFAAGGTNTFFFVPEMPFDRFVYTLQAEVYSEACYTNLFQYSWSFQKIDVPYWPDWKAADNSFTLAMKGGEFDAPPPDNQLIPCIIFDLTHECAVSFQERVCVWESVLFLNEQDEVIDFQPDWITSVYYPMEVGNRVGKGKEYYFFPNADELTWPEDLQSDLTVLVGVTKAEAIPLEKTGEG